MKFLLVNMFKGMNHITQRACILLLLVYTQIAFGEPIPPKQEPAIFVNDYIQLLNSDERNSLESKLQNYYDTTSTQLVVVIVNNLEGMAPWEYAQQLGEKWGIGQAKKDNGLVFLIAKEEHKVFLATGYGLEDKITDALSKRIISQIITPRFKAGNYAEGIDAALNKMMELCSGQFTADPKDEGVNFSWTHLIIILILLFLFLRIVAKNNRANTYHNGGLDSWGPSWTGGGLGGGSWGGGGFGGGGSGGGSFGGGGFGGGGAGGSW